MKSYGFNFPLLLQAPYAGKTVNLYYFAASKRDLKKKYVLQYTYEKKT
jgi:hypothetical protein